MPGQMLGATFQNLVKTFAIEHPDVERKRKPWRIGCGVCFALADKPKGTYCRYAECDVPKYVQKG